MSGPLTPKELLLLIILIPYWAIKNRISNLWERFQNLFKKEGDKSE